MVVTNILSSVKSIVCTPKRSENYRLLNSPKLSLRNLNIRNYEKDENNEEVGDDCLPA